MINRLLWRMVSSRKFWLLACLLGAMTSLAYGLGALLRDATSSLLLPVAIIGALIGYGLGTSRLKGWQAGGGGVILGVGGIFFRIGNLWVPTAGLLSTIPNFCAQVMLWLTEDYQPDFSFQQFFLDDFAQRCSGLAIRGYTWGYGLFKGIVATDPAARALTWGLGIWLIAFWAGWALARGRNAITVLAPALALLALINDYSRANPLTVLIMLAFALLLLGIGRFDNQVLRWKKNGIDFSDSTTSETTLALVIAAVFLTLLAWLAPSISVKALWDEWRTQSSGRDTVAESLGIVPPAPEESKVQNYTRTGLPRSHLLGAGPDLEKILVFTVSTGELPPIANAQTMVSVPTYYWRSITYDNYLGSGWSTSQTEDEEYAAGTPVLPAEPEKHKRVQQVFTHYQGNDARLYFTGALLSADQPITVAWRTKPGALDDPTRGADIFGAIVPATKYTVVSYVPQISEEKLRASPTEIPESIRSRYTQLPTSVPERVLSLARDLTASATTEYDQALAIQTYLRRTYPYTLDIPAPPAGRDVADYFLFDLKKGYCDYYATAMVVLARAVGIPTRMVSGYAPGMYDAPTALYVVKEINAHSWVEIYFPNIGWVEFEPTSAYSEILHPGAPKIPTPPILPAEKGTFSQLWDFLNGKNGIFAWAGLGLFGFLLLVVLVQWLEQIWLLRLDTVRAATALFRGMEKFGEAAAGTRVEKETPYEFSGRLKSHLAGLSRNRGMHRYFQKAEKEVNDITALYIAAVFSQHLPARQQMRLTAKAWGRLRARLALGWFMSRMQTRRQKTTL